jgi:hypothetical protein
MSSSSPSIQAESLSPSEMSPNMRSSELLRSVMPAAPEEPTAQQSHQPSAVAELLPLGD